MRLLRRARLPGRDQHRRARAAARRLPRRQEGATHLRQGDPRASTCSRPRRRRQRPVHGERRQPGPSPGGLPLLPRRPRRCATSSSSRSSSATTTPASRRATRSPIASGRSRRVGTLPDRRLRRVGAAGRRQGLRVAVRRGAGIVGRGPAGAVHLRRDVRRRGGPRAQRRPLLVRPLRRARLTCSATSPTPTWSSWSPRRSSAPSGTPSATRCRATAASARCASPATASARRTGSPSPPTASPASTTSAPATRRSSPTSTDRCDSWPGWSPGRYADEIIPMLASAGRNDPCPCGSGRKAKHCHQA